MKTETKTLYYTTLEKIVSNTATPRDRILRVHHDILQKYTLYFTTIEKIASKTANPRDRIQRVHYDMQEKYTTIEKQCSFH